MAHNLETKIVIVLLKFGLVNDAARFVNEDILIRMQIWPLRWGEKTITKTSMKLFTITNLSHDLLIKKMLKY